MAPLSSEKKEYLPIQSLDIEAESTITFDLYVNLPLNQKLILYRRSGGNIANSRLDSLARNNVKNFYIHRDDYQKFVRYVANRVISLLGEENTTINLMYMASTTKAILSSTFAGDDPAVTQALMENLVDITQTVIEAVLEISGTYNKKTFFKLLDLAKSGSAFQKHPVNVASLSVMIACGIGYNSEKIISDLAIASLLHDVGLTKLPLSVIGKAHFPDKMVYSEREQLYGHPQETLRILRDKNIDLSPLAQLIILQHHEEFSGFGYPARVRGYNVNEFAQILRVADEIDGLVQEGLDGSIPEIKVAVKTRMDQLERNKVVEPQLLQRIVRILF